MTNYTNEELNKALGVMIDIFSYTQKTLSMLDAIANNINSLKIDGGELKALIKALIITAELYKIKTIGAEKNAKMIDIVTLSKETELDALKEMLTTIRKQSTKMEIDDVNTNDK